MMRALVLLIAVFLCTVFADTNPSYDHQTKTYYSHIDPYFVADRELNIVPFFSPDHSVDVQTHLIESAKERIDIGIPSWSAWNGCSSSCVPTKMRADTFPVWQALLNAAHRGVTVRLLTNDYEDPPPPTGQIDPLTFLFLNGIDVRFFTTVTFLHSKYIANENTTSVSSVNFSQTAFMKNREAGVLINGTYSHSLREFFNNTFNEDFEAAYKLVPRNTYNESELAIITNPAEIPVIIPPRNNISAYITPLTLVNGTMSVQGIASPDYAYQTITDAMDKAKHSIQVYIYQITEDLCDYILRIPKHISLKILVSANIYSQKDAKLAEECYESLHSAGIFIQVAPKVFTYSHNKFWIIDEGNPDASVFVSTGNWGETDYPDGPNVFPPYSQDPSHWRPINRDFTVQVYDDEVIDIFSKTLDMDYQQGTPYQPGNFYRL